MSTITNNNKKEQRQHQWKEFLFHWIISKTLSSWLSWKEEFLLLLNSNKRYKGDQYMLRHKKAHRHLKNYLFAVILAYFFLLDWVLHHNFLMSKISYTCIPYLHCMEKLIMRSPWFLMEQWLVWLLWCCNCIYIKGQILLYS